MASLSSMYVSNCFVVYGVNVGVDTTITNFFRAAKYVMVTTPLTLSLRCEVGIKIKMRVKLALTGTMAFQRTGG